MSPERGFDYRKQPTFPGWGARREWPPLNPIPMDPNTYTYISAEHLTELFEDCPECPGEVDDLSGIMPDPIIITATGPQGVDAVAIWETPSWASATWVTANMAYFYPFQVVEEYTTAKIFWTNGSTVSGNVDAGIYDVSGTRLGSIGSTAQAGTTAIQSASLAVTLTPGRYYMALVLDNTTGTIRRASGGAIYAGGAGQLQMASAFALPASATFATLTGTPGTQAIGITKRSTI